VNPALRPRAIVFDFDGTLADTWTLTVRLLPQLARELRFRDPGPEGFAALRGLGIRQILSELEIAAWKVPLLLWRARQLIRKHSREVKLFPGTTALLERLDGAGIPWGILSTNSHALVRETLEREGCPEPGWLQAGLGLTGKTGPLRRMAELWEISPSDLWLVGDETRDVEAAHRAGCPCVGVAWGYSHPSSLAQAGAVCVAENLDSLTALLLGRSPTDHDGEAGVSSSSTGEKSR
jgi:phosphoglycolate phosphatase